MPTTAVDTSGSYSVSAWVKPSSVSGNQTYASIDGSSISPFYLQLSGGTFAFTSPQRRLHRRELQAGHRRLPDDRHLVPPSPASTTTAPTPSPCTSTAPSRAAPPSPPRGRRPATTAIGRAKWNGANVDFANGAIDDVRMIPRALTAREAYALGTGAAGYYQLDEGSGSPSPTSSATR
ncbi:hypothetical protein ACRAWF_22410 [Streptomyces sp. L7]